MTVRRHKHPYLRDTIPVMKTKGIQPDKKQSQAKIKTDIIPSSVKSGTEAPKRRFGQPTAEFTQALAREIVRNLTTFGQLTTRPFRRTNGEKKTASKPVALGEFPILVDTSVLIDGRILPVVNAGFLSGTLVIPEIVLAEVQHIADSPDMIRRTKGRRGLDVVSKLKGQKANDRIKVKIINEDPQEIKEVDRKLLAIAKRYKVKLLTIDFNLAQLARAEGVRVINIHDLAQALRVALVPGEELTIQISHEGKERAQGVGYLPDGTMVIVDDARDKVGVSLIVVVTKVHQTPAGQLFFARLKN